jgi:hypothetical protein
MTAEEVFNQQDGEVTKAYYAEMNQKGIPGQLAVALFRAQKRSTAAKKYRGGRFRRDAYDVKNWSLSEICRILSLVPGLFEWGWKADPNTIGFPWVLYVVLPQGQCSFHSADRLEGPDFVGDWDGLHLSRERILAFCDSVGDHPVENVIVKPQKKEPVSPWDAMKQQVSQ